MTTSEYFSAEIYRQHEREMIQRLEWQRRATERAGQTIELPHEPRGLRAAIGVRIKGVQALIRHQPVRG